MTTMNPTDTHDPMSEAMVAEIRSVAAVAPTDNHLALITVVALLVEGGKTFEALHALAALV